MHRWQEFALALALAGAVLAWSRSASAASAEPQEASGSGGPTARPRIGVIGGLGFPRPLAVEGLVKLNGVVALGAEYGVLPSTTVGGVQTSLSSVAGDVRVFPFRGPLFVGLRAGHQRVEASTAIAVGQGSVGETLALESWFVNPRIGLLWTSSAGLTLGMEAGVQIPVQVDASSTLPLSLDPQVQQTAQSLNSAVLPTVDLLRVGWLF